LTGQARQLGSRRRDHTGTTPIANREGNRLVRAWRILGAMLVISTYFATAPIGYGIFAIWALIPTRNRVRRAHSIQFIMRYAFRSMHAVLRWFGLLDFDPSCVTGEIPSTPCVWVANHPTLTDVSALLATERRLVFPVKPGLFRSFWARPVLANAFTPSQVIDDAVDRLERGYRVIIFPEGTRSPRKGLHPFGRTAFEIAKRAGVPIIPIVITCKPRWLWKEQSFLNPPSSLPRLRLRALPAVHPGQLGSSSRALRDIVFEQISAELGLADRS
jgi:1-acyl-sn-glycerol-3-phosphate acyltransferase